MSISRCCLAAIVAAAVSCLPAQGDTAPDKTTAGRAAARPVGPAGLVVGVVDLGKAFDLYPRTIKEQERLQKLREDSREMIDKISKRIDEMKGSILVLKEGSFERDQKQMELELTMQERQGRIKLLSDRLQLEEMRTHLLLYEDLDAAVARLAKDRGVHLVLRVDQNTAAPADDTGNPKVVEKRLLAFDRRQVWFASEQLDLTADLIKLLQVWPLEVGKDAPPAAPPAGADKGGAGGGE
jgi:Skp family chaperone for outer membrane proteins